MKRYSFLQVVVLAALLVTIGSCGTPMYSEGDSYETAPRANVYYGDPYYGGVNSIVVERDPYTGRYYQVNPGLYGGIYSAPAAPYYGGRRYNNNRYYNNRNCDANRNYSSGNNGYYRTYPQQQRQQPQQSPVQRQQMQQQRNEAKDAILGRGRRS